MKSRARLFRPIFFTLLSASLLASPATLHADVPEAKRILFLGDSITYAGTYIEFIEAALIARLPDRKIEILNIGLPSETVSGLSEEGHANGKFPRPDLHERLDRVLAQSKPDLILACYGMNDGIYFPLAEERFARFREGMIKLHQKAEAIGAKIVHLTPPVFDPVPIKQKVLPAGRNTYPGPYEGYNEVLDAYADWLIKQRGEQGWNVIDLHGPMKAAMAEKRKADPQFTYARDGIHPNADGHLIMANAVLEAWGQKPLPSADGGDPKTAAVLKVVQQKQRLLKDAWLTATKHLRPGMKAGLPLAEATAKATALDEEARGIAKGTIPAPAAKASAFPGTTSDWNGYEKHDFMIDGKPVLVIEPKKAAPGRPWVWHGEFFGHKPAPDIALLGKGFHIAHMRVPDMLGCPDAVQHWNAFYKELTTRYGLSKKPALVGLSRGGLYCYNWAIANPDKVSCIYGDAPVCDFKSWPGGKGKGKGDAKNWALVLKLWHFKDEADALAYTGNPVDNLAPLAKQHVPLLHVFGDADDVVPWEENTALIAEHYKALGGSITLIRKPGIGHHPHGLDDSTPIIDFIQKHASAAAIGN